MSDSWAELVRAKTNIYSKNLMGVTDLKDYFRDYLLERIRLFSRLSYPYSGVFRFGGLSSQIVDGISLLAGLGIDNNGNITYWPNYQNMPVPYADTDDALTLYYGVKYSELPGDVELNPKTGSVEYARMYEVIGDRGNPDSVTDNGDGTLTFNVNTLFYNISGAGRVVRIMLGVPQTLTGWYTDCVVSFDGTDNTITIDSFLGSPVADTDPLNYIVWAIGPAVTEEQLVGGVPEARGYLTDSHIFLGTTTQTPRAATSISVANPSVVTLTAHGFVPDTEIMFATSGTLPTPLTANTKYYVISTDLATNTFKFSATKGGTGVEVTGAGSGTHYVISAPVWEKDNIVWVQAVTDHHTANLPIEIQYPHHLKELDKYYYPQDNLLWKSYFQGTSGVGWTLAHTGNGAIALDTSGYGDYGTTSVKYTGTAGADGTGSIKGNQTDEGTPIGVNNFVKVGRGADISFQIRAYLTSGSLSGKMADGTTDEGVDLKFNVYEKDGTTLIETITLSTDTISIAGKWWMLYYNGWRNDYERTVVIVPEVLVRSNVGCVIYFSNIKLEYGSSVTIYTPHNHEINGPVGTGTVSTITTSTSSTSSTSTTSWSWTTSNTYTGTGTGSGTTAPPTTSPSETTTPQHVTEPLTATTTTTVTTSTGGGGGCVVGDTLIRMAVGAPKKISEVQKGDTVLTYDVTGKEVPGRVTKTMEHIGKYIVYILNVDGRELRITADHKISAPLSNGKIAYEAVYKLIRDKVKTFCPEHGWSDITVVGEEVVERVYNITVAVAHSYIANGVLVSNVKNDGSNPNQL